MLCEKFDRAPDTEENSCPACDIPNEEDTEITEKKSSKNPFCLPSSITEWLLIAIIPASFVFYFLPAFKIELLGRVSKSIDYFLINSLDIDNTNLIFIAAYVLATVIMATKLPKALKAAGALSLSVWSLFWFTVAYFACNDMYKRGGFSIVISGWIYLALTILTAAVSAVMLIISLNKKPSVSKNTRQFYSPDGE